MEENKPRVEDFKKNLIELQLLFKQFFVYNQDKNENNSFINDSNSSNSTSTLQSIEDNTTKEHDFNNDECYEDEDDREYIINNKIKENNSKWLNINEIDTFYSNTLNNINNINNQMNNLKNVNNVNNVNNINNVNKNSFKIIKEKVYNSSTSTQSSESPSLSSTTFSTLSHFSSSTVDLYTKLNISTYKISSQKNKKKRSISFFENENSSLNAYITNRANSDLPTKKIKNTYQNPLKLSL
ncbi:hypothetical protein DICPUDRAFT_77172 [Dictyostelium purpureum]|uniref:Uncharacterized protein n=1 Tax=Dictyostelium purpureum TaxID=5786 RepID=F0ZFU0_DICPU|nr:uncharacterized protein DICPUDRAFT_77172 [Dictyostelium purpureum]EGC37169.1 hypothetical protein DICPUDRAFT_77172 [Dictyostelium purpureum]|eukprot:XP_003286297.1 hypothetical protein DICPUDRAFT_77172 [Dictyostelium purpureum]